MVNPMSDCGKDTSRYVIYRHYNKFSETQMVPSRPYWSN